MDQQFRKQLPSKVRLTLASHVKCATGGKEKQDLEDLREKAEFGLERDSRSQF